jgi:hypothetical protein
MTLTTKVWLRALRCFVLYNFVVVAGVVLTGAGTTWRAGQADAHHVPADDWRQPKTSCWADCSPQHHIRRRRQSRGGSPFARYWIALRNRAYARKDLEVDKGPDYGEGATPVGNRSSRLVPDAPEGKGLSQEC